ncbi:MAG: large conductance mechanosensitive channel protein [Actinomycetia bacterium]|nr:large conductance mechanosensitive channel protein [Actinomycetes bacterium]
MPRFHVLADFRKFVLRGNVLDLAVAVILGAAFGLVVQSFTNDVLMNFIAAIFGKANFDAVTFNVGDGTIYIGRFITAVINFVIIAFVLFLIIRAFEKLQSLRGRTPEEAAVSAEIQLLTEIRDELREGKVTP